QKRVREEAPVLHICYVLYGTRSSRHGRVPKSGILWFRRGQVFHLVDCLGGDPWLGQCFFFLRVSPGPNPSIAKHTLVVLDLRTPSDHHNWQATLQNESGKEVTVAVTSTPNAILGKYQLCVKTGKHILKSEENILYLLCNPWCKEDTVFMPDEDERKEYILNDTGCHYVGAAGSIKYKPWNFGQVMISPCSSEEWTLTPPLCVWQMSFEKGQGVLVGNWTGDYQDGTAPYKWTGSAPILQQYYSTKQAVRFGQCWVFAGILTTVLRALGIPARSVTAFDSAHDTEKNLTVDTYVNENGEKITNMSRDSVWNFHVWTDAWMKRPDLPKGYDGWQAVDATPQERSQGVFCCGPSPLTAIRKGDIFIVYDTRFVFSEVNGDRLIWLVKMVNGQEELHIISVETTSIGKNISTKAVGQDRRRDITYEYKYPEGSPEERQVMDHAFLLLSSEREHRRPVKENFLHMSVQSDDALLGNPVNFTVILKRKTAALQNVNISGSFELQLYTGKKVAKLCALNKTSQIQGQVSEVTLTLDSKTYINSLAMLDDEPVIRGFIIAEIVESKEIMASEVFVSFQYPEFSVELPNTGRVGQLLVCNCIFRNTLAIPLTDVKFSLESLGISSLQTSEHGTVQPGETIQSQIKCIPIKTGPKKFIIKLSSKQVKEINAQKIVLITK
uniref:Transglutaminase 4 n=1 Tax=Macaca nemestrina TaxID=9545 RepID=A0A2K6DYC1_MACNE